MSSNDTSNEARQLVKKYGSIRAAAKAAGLCSTTFRRRLEGINARKGPELPPESATPPCKKRRAGLSEREFLQKFDVNVRMRGLLAQAVKLIEKRRFYQDHEMRRLVSCGDCRLWRDLANDPGEGFAAFQFRMGDTVYWSDPESVKDILSKNSKARPLAEA